MCSWCVFFVSITIHTPNTCTHTSVHSTPQRFFEINSFNYLPWQNKYLIIATNMTCITCSHKQFSASALTHTRLHVYQGNCNDLTLYFRSWLKMRNCLSQLYKGTYISIYNTLSVLQNRKRKRFSVGTTTSISRCITWFLRTQNCYHFKAKNICYFTVSCVLTGLKFLV